MITEHQRSAGIVTILFLLISLYGHAQSSDSLLVEDMRQEGIQFTNQNSIKLLMSGREKFADMFEAIRQAKSLTFCARNGRKVWRYVLSLMVLAMTPITSH